MLWDNPCSADATSTMIGKDNGFPSVLPSRRTLLVVIIAAALVIQDGSVATFKTKTLHNRLSMRKEIPPTSS